MIVNVSFGLSSSIHSLNSYKILETRVDTVEPFTALQFQTTKDSFIQIIIRRWLLERKEPKSYIYQEMKERKIMSGNKNDSKEKCSTDLYGLSLNPNSW